MMQSDEMIVGKRVSLCVFCCTGCICAVWGGNIKASLLPSPFQTDFVVACVCGCYMVYWWHPVDLFVTLYKKKKKKKHISPSCQSIQSERHVGLQGTSVEACQTSSNQMEQFPPSHRSEASREREMHGGVVQSEWTPKWRGAARTGSSEWHTEHALLFTTAFWPAGHMTPLHRFPLGEED